MKARGADEDFDAPFKPKSTAEIAYQQLLEGVITQEEYDAIMQGEKVFQKDRAAQKRKRKNYMISIEDVAFQQLLEGQINQEEFVARILCFGFNVWHDLVFWCQICRDGA